LLLLGLVFSRATEVEDSRDPRPRHSIERPAGANVNGQLSQDESNARGRPQREEIPAKNFRAENLQIPLCRTDQVWRKRWL